MRFRLPLIQRGKRNENYYKKQHFLFGVLGGVCRGGHPDLALLYPICQIVATPHAQKQPACGGMRAVSASFWSVLYAFAPTR